MGGEGDKGTALQRGQRGGGLVGRKGDGGWVILVKEDTSYSH